MLIIDNYDSFTYNIVQYIKILGTEPIVINNDEMTVKAVKNLRFKKIILSPGWGNPDNAGISTDIIDYYQDKTPMLGICLGMQCIAKYFGAKIINAPEPFHGKNSKIYFNEDFLLFKNMPQGFSATRYHSLMISSISKEIEVEAKTKDNIPMAIRIKNKPIFGVQFHPEAIMTENGINIFKNFLNIKI